jgi:phosphoglucomutase
VAGELCRGCQDLVFVIFWYIDAGKSFFVTPSDSVALIAASAAEAIPYFKGGLKVLVPDPHSRDSLVNHQGVKMTANKGGPHVLL